MQKFFGGLDRFVIFVTGYEGAVSDFTGAFPASAVEVGDRPARLARYSSGGTSPKTTRQSLTEDTWMPCLEPVAFAMRSPGP